VKTYFLFFKKIFVVFSKKENMDEEKKDKYKLFEEKNITINIYINFQHKNITQFSTKPMS